MDITNLTPHKVVIRTRTGDIVLPPSGVVARVNTTDVVVDHFNGIPVVKTTKGKVTGVPPTGAILVSAMVLDLLQGRPDTYAPDTGPDSAVRNDQGQIVAVTRLKTV